MTESKRAFPRISTLAVLCSLLAISCAVFASGENTDKNVYVDKSAAPGGDGSKEKPFKSLKRVRRRGPPNRTVWIAPGRYHQKLFFKYGNGLTIRALDPDNPPVICGTKPVSSEGWTRVDNEKNIWSLQGVKNKYWQFFCKPKVIKRPWRCMIAARWPNVKENFDIPYRGSPWEPVEGNYWNMDSTWARLGDGSTWKGKFVNNTNFHKLSEVKGSLTGAVLIQFRCLKTGNNIWQTHVTKHEAGSEEFERRHPSRGMGRNRFKEARFYFEGKRVLLDSPGEWFIQGTKDNYELLVCLPAGKTPAYYDFEGRTCPNVLKVRCCNGFHLKGVELFAGSFNLAYCVGAKLEDSRFLYSGHNRFVLGKMTNARFNMLKKCRKSTVLNCVFAYNERDCLMLESSGVLVKNCLFKNSQFGPTKYGAVPDHKYSGLRLIRNTFDTIGLQNVSKNGRNGRIMWNHTRNMMWPGDFSCHQVSQAAQRSTHIHHNWIIDAYSRNGVRFDGDPANRHCRVNHVVAMGCGRGFRLKGDKHKIYHLTALGNKPKRDINIAHDKFYGYNKKGRPINGRRGSVPCHGNELSLVKNIAGQNISKWPLPPKPENQGGIWNGGARGQRLSNQLRDPRNLDFRPRKGSGLIDAGVVIPGINDYVTDGKPDAGAYEYGAKNYWIPGRKEKQAGTPIPRNGTTNAKPDADLMWLECYRYDAERDSHKVYFSNHKKAVEKRDASAFKGEQKNNIFSPGRLAIGTHYYWAIDEVVDGKTIPGKLWSFVPDDVPAGKIVNAPCVASTAVFANPEAKALKVDGSLTTVGWNGLILLGFSLADLPSAEIISAKLRFHCTKRFPGGRIQFLKAPISDTTTWENKPGGEGRKFRFWHTEAGTARYADLTKPLTAALKAGKKEISIAISNAKNQLASAIADHKAATPTHRPVLQFAFVVNNPPYFTGNTFDLHEGKVGIPYEASLANYAADIDPDDRDKLTYRMEGAPAWLKLDPKTGKLTGTPTTRGSKMIQVIVSDGKESSSAQMTVSMIKPSTRR